MIEPFDRLLSFVSVHHAIRAEKLLVSDGIMAQMVPTPRAISISCGQCLLFTATNQQRVMTMLRQFQLEWSILFQCNCTQHIYEEIERK